MIRVVNALGRPAASGESRPFKKESVDRRGAKRMYPGVGALGTPTGNAGEST